MTKKDYKKFAAVIKESFERYGGRFIADRATDFLKYEIAGIFAADNPRFDREKFYQACQPK